MRESGDTPHSVGCTTADAAVAETRMRVPISSGMTCITPRLKRSVHHDPYNRFGTILQTDEKNIASKRADHLQQSAQTVVIGTVVISMYLGGMTNRTKTHIVLGKSRDEVTIPLAVNWSLWWIRGE